MVPGLFINIFSLVFVSLCDGGKLGDVQAVPRYTIAICDPDGNRSSLSANNEAVARDNTISAIE